MYPSLPDTDGGFTGLCDLPDGRTVYYQEWGFTEGDTGAYVQTEMCIQWYLSGVELTDEEINAEIEHDGRTYFLHEYVAENYR